MVMQNLFVIYLIAWLYQQTAWENVWIKDEGSDRILENIA